MKVYVVLAACLLVACAEERSLVMTTTTAKPTTTTTLPCQTPPPVLIPCPVCVNYYCTPNMCNQAAHVPYPGDCTRFCICDSNGAYAFDCPDGLYFNAALQVCDWPSSSGCTTQNTMLPGC